jgi:hypothetical protein
VYVCILAGLLSLAFIIFVFPSLGLEINPEAPCGIISLELAGTVEKADSIKHAWVSKFEGLQPAWLSICLDFAFIVVYAAALGLACVRAHEMFRVKSIGVGLGLSRIGVLLAWGVCIAGLLDVFENLAMIVVLRGTQDEIWPQLAHSLATVKFALILEALPYGAIGFACSLYDWWSWVSARRRT